MKKDIPKSGSSRNFTNKGDEYDSENEFKTKKKINEEFYLPVIDEDTSRGVKIQRVNRKTNWAQSKSPIQKKKNSDENDVPSNTFKICRKLNLIQL